MLTGAAHVCVKMDQNHSNITPKLTKYNRSGDASQSLQNHPKADQTQYRMTYQAEVGRADVEDVVIIVAVPAPVNIFRNLDP